MKNAKVLRSSFEGHHKLSIKKYPTTEKKRRVMKKVPYLLWAF
jgi:hypothetical protein